MKPEKYNMKNKINCPCSKKRGFTLLEITVVVAIITLLSTIFLANYRAGERVFALQRSIHKLSQDLRRVEEMAISAQGFKESDDTSTFPKGGYGIYFKINPTFGECENVPNGYCIFLFADCNGDKQYNGPAAGIISCADATSENPFSNGEKIEELSLENGIKVSEFSHSEYYDYLNITFFPPDPEVTFNFEGSTIEEDFVSITLTINGSSKMAKVYKTGLIDID